MADDSRVRSQRLGDPYRRGAAPAEVPGLGPIEDPLAELVRLIGQPDRYTDNVRGPQRSELPHTGLYRDSDPSVGDRFDRDEPQIRSRHDDHDPYRMASLRQDYGYADDPYGRDQREPSYAGASAHTQRGHGAPHFGDRPFDRMETQGDDTYDDPPPRKRGGAFVTAVVLIACAMLGTAGAYSYRTYMGSAGTKSAPVIVADTAPNKIVPSSVPKTTRPQDRVGGQGNERLVSREEQPVALPATSAGAVPLVVLPPRVQQSPAVTGATPSTASGSLDQPRPVRTVPIRQDGNDPTGQQALDSDLRGAAPPSAARSAPGTRAAVAPPTTAPAPRAARDQPLSLDPNAPALQSVPQRPAAPSAPREASAPAPPAPRVAAAPPAGGDGGYVVQVSSQRSEAEAQASFRSLQAKYAQLKSRQLIIRRADLGAKGIYFRAMVGPFESSEDANQFCSDLKQAGGQCLIQRN